MSIAPGVHAATQQFAVPHSAVLPQTSSHVESAAMLANVARNVLNQLPATLAGLQTSRGGTLTAGGPTVSHAVAGTLMNSGGVSLKNITVGGPNTIDPAFMGLLSAGSPSPSASPMSSAALGGAPSTGALGLGNMTSTALPPPTSASDTTSKPQSRQTTSSAPSPTSAHSTSAAKTSSNTKSSKSTKSTTKAAPVKSSSSTTSATQKVVDFVQAQKGKSYVFGASGPDSYDCSGLAMAAWKKAGTSLPHSSSKMYDLLPHVPLDQAKAGDLVFFAGSDGTMSEPGHVGIVVDPAKHLMIDASRPGKPIQTENYSTWKDLFPVIGRPTPGKSYS